MRWLFLALVVASWAYWFTACWLVRSKIYRKRGPVSDFTPGVSMLKPVMGLDYQMYENFVSFVRQDYPEYELLFGVSDASDPAVDVVKRLQRDYPRQKIRLYVAPPIGVNRKASILETLASYAAYDVLVVSDSDMRVTPDYVRRVVAPLANEQIGLVTCPYRGKLPLTLTARLEALHMGVSFLPAVMVGRLVGVPFGLGATMALRKRDLERIGGFAAVANHLADDYEVGERIAGLGLAIHLSDYVVDSVIGITTFPVQWHREVRWARCTRVSQTAAYPGLLLTFTVPLALLLVAVSGADLLSLAVLGVSLALRWAVAWLVTVYTDNQAIRRWLVLLPVRDMLSALVWSVGAVGRHVEWRGVKYTVLLDGRLQVVPPKSPVANPLLAAKLIRALDTLLRRVYHVTEFAHGPEALLRLSITKAKRDLVLSDGTHVHAGDPVAILHFWNEHMPIMSEDGPDLRWGLAFRRRLSNSLRDVAAYVQTDPDYLHVVAFQGPTTFGSAHDFQEATRIVGHWGFDLVPTAKPRGWLQRFGRFWENVYATWLIWAYNPPSLKNKSLSTLRWDELWISRAKLMEVYPPHLAPSAAPARVERGQLLAAAGFEEHFSSTDSTGGEA